MSSKIGTQQIINQFKLNKKDKFNINLDNEIKLLNNNNYLKEFIIDFIYYVDKSIIYATLEKKKKKELIKITEDLILEFNKTHYGKSVIRKNYMLITELIIMKFKYLNNIKRNIHLDKIINYVISVIENFPLTNNKLSVFNNLDKIYINLKGKQINTKELKNKRVRQVKNIYHLSKEIDELIDVSNLINKDILYYQNKNNKISSQPSYHSLFNNGQFSSNSLNKPINISNIISYKYYPSNLSSTNNLSILEKPFEKKYTIIIDPAGAAFKKTSNSYNGASAFSEKLYNMMEDDKNTNDSTYKSEKTKLGIINAGEAKLNPRQFKKNGNFYNVIHAVGPDGRESNSIEYYWNTLEKTIKSISHILNKNFFNKQNSIPLNYVEIRLPMISSGVFKPRHYQNIDFFYKLYFSYMTDFINKYLKPFSDSIVLGIFTTREKEQFSKFLRENY